MAVGEYVSVSSQRDTERALLRLEKSEIEQYPQQEFEELTDIYIGKGLSNKTAKQVAKELTQKDAYRAHLDAELAINPDDLVNPWQATFSSAAAFLAGSLLPMLAIMLPPKNIRIAVTFISTIIALAINGAMSAKFGGAPIKSAVMRVSAGGALAMIVTYAIGRLIGASSF
jgi:vacuolar iron transporter family protein